MSTMLQFNSGGNRGVALNCEGTSSIRIIPGYKHIRIDRNGTGQVVECISWMAYIINDQMVPGCQSTDRTTLLLLEACISK